MADGRWQMADGRWQMVNGNCLLPPRLILVLGATRRSKLSGLVTGS